MRFSETTIWVVGGVVVIAIFLLVVRYLLPEQFLVFL
jgi:hypothetical protein